MSSLSRAPKRFGQVARLALLAGAGLLAPLAGGAQSSAAAPDMLEGPPAPPVLKLWSRRPAVLDRPEPGVLPPFHSGNHHVGLLVSGSVEHERIRLLAPELASFPGPPVKPLDPVDVVPRLREQVAAGRYGDVVKLAEKELLTGTEARFAPQVLCELQIDYQPTAQVEEYRRELDLRTGVVTVTWREGKTRHTRTLHADQPSALVLMEWKAEGPEGITAVLRYAPYPEGTFRTIKSFLELNGQAGGSTPQGRKPGAHFFSLTQVSAGGHPKHPWSDDAYVLRGEQALECQHATSVSLMLSGSVRKDAEAAREEAIHRYALRFGIMHPEIHQTYQRRRMEGDPLGTDLPGRAELPTDERLEAVRKGAEDPALAGLLFQYGRYLRGASSLTAQPTEFPPRPAALPRGR